MSRRAVVARELFVDSSAWIAFFSARDQNHANADKLVRAALKARRRLITTNLVLSEVHRLLLFRAGIRPAGAAIDHLCNSVEVEIQFTGPEHHERARKWINQLSDQVITYTDANSFAVMESRKLRDAMTFDRDFAIAGFSIWDTP